jgi:hypothetical protein
MWELYMDISCLLSPGVVDEQGNQDYDGWSV